VAARLARVRSGLAQSGLDALVVTHLPNLLYLTGFVGSAGAALVLRHRCLLIVDFRYVTAASSLAASLGGHVRVETFDRSYDEAIVEILGRDFRRTGRGGAASAALGRGHARTGADRARGGAGQDH
jgi:Xaa-Pro aminopeptidase